MPRVPAIKLPADAPTWAADLSPREFRFVCEYLIDLNGTEAAIRAGLGKSRKSSTQMASKLKKKANVATAIAAALAERGNATGSRVVEEIGRVAFARITDITRVEGGCLIITDTAQLTEDQQAAIAEISETITEQGRTIKVKLHDKLSALDKLAKVLALYKDRLEVSGPRGGPVQLEDLTGAAVREQIDAMLDQLERSHSDSHQMVTIEPPPRRAKPLPTPKMGRVIDAD